MRDQRGGFVGIVVLLLALWLHPAHAGPELLVDAHAGPASGSASPLVRLRVIDGASRALISQIETASPSWVFGVGAVLVPSIVGSEHPDVLVPDLADGFATQHPGRVHVYDGESGSLVRTLAGRPGEMLSWYVQPTWDVDRDAIGDIWVETALDLGDGLLTDGWVIFSGASGQRIVAGEWPDIWRDSFVVPAIATGRAGHVKSNLGAGGDPWDLGVDAGIFAGLASGPGSDGALDLQELFEQAVLLGQSVPPQFAVVHAGTTMALNRALGSPALPPTMLGRFMGCMGPIAGLATRPPPDATPDGSHIDPFTGIGRAVRTTRSLFDGSMASFDTLPSGCDGMGLVLAGDACECDRLPPDVIDTGIEPCNQANFTWTGRVSAPANALQGATVTATVTSRDETLGWSVMATDTAGNPVPVEWSETIDGRSVVYRAPSLVCTVVVRWFGRCGEIAEGETKVNECSAITLRYDNIVSAMAVTGAIVAEYGVSYPPPAWEVLQGGNLILDQATTPDGRFVFIPRPNAMGRLIVRATLSPPPELALCSAQSAVATIWLSTTAGSLNVNQDGDGDGLTDVCELQFGLNPLQPDVYELLADSDGDGLADAVECSQGTDPFAGDSDFDGLPDGFETTIGTDPNDWDSNDDGVSDGESVDSDGDGVSNFDEGIYGTDPFVADTDGDGAADGAEIRFHADPLDITDGGLPPPEEELVDVTVRVGDDSGSMSEIWALRIGALNVRAPGYGAVITRTFTLRRGRGYPVSLEHIGTNIDGEPDFDYEAELSAEDDDPLVVVDPDRLLGLHSNDVTWRDKKALLLLPHLQPMRRTGATTFERAGAVATSHAIPTFGSLGGAGSGEPQIVLSQPQFGTQPSGLAADISIALSLDDAFSDFVAGPTGTITSVDVWVNDEVVESVPVSVTKRQSRGSHEATFDFLGHVIATLPRVEVQPGWNRVRVVATNGQGHTGFAERSFRVDVASIEYADLILDLRDATMSPPPPIGLGDPTTLPRIDGTAELTVTTSVGAQTYELVGGPAGSLLSGDGVSCGLFDRIPTIAPWPQRLPATVSVPWLDMDGAFVEFEQTADAGIYRGTLDGNLIDHLAGASVTIGESTPVTGTGPGLMDPFYLTVVDLTDVPDDFLELLQDNPPGSALRDSDLRMRGPPLPLTFGGADAPYIFVGDDPASDQPPIYFLTRSPGMQPDALRDTITAIDTPFEQHLLDTLGPPSEVREFSIGFWIGFGETYTTLWSDLRQTFDLVTHLLVHYNSISVTIRIVSGEDVLLEEDEAFLRETWDTVRPIAALIYELLAERFELEGRALVGDTAAWHQLNEQNSQALALCSELIREAWEYLEGLPPREKGRIVGLIYGEALNTVVTAGVGTAASAGLKSTRIVVLIQKLSSSPALGRVLGPAGAAALVNRLTDAGNAVLDAVRAGRKVSGQDLLALALHVQKAENIADKDIIGTIRAVLRKLDEFSPDGKKYTSPALFDMLDALQAARYSEFVYDASDPLGSIARAGIPSHRQLRDVLDGRLSRTAGDSAAIVDSEVHHTAVKSVVKTIFDQAGVVYDDALLDDMPGLVLTQLQHQGAARRTLPDGKLSFHRHLDRVMKQLRSEAGIDGDSQLSMEQNIEAIRTAYNRFESEWAGDTSVPIGKVRDAAEAWLRHHVGGGAPVP